MDKVLVTVWASQYRSVPHWGGSYLATTSASFGPARLDWLTATPTDLAVSTPSKRQQACSTRIPQSLIHQLKSYKRKNFASIQSFE